MYELHERSGTSRASGPPDNYFKVAGDGGKLIIIFPFRSDDAADVARAHRDAVDELTIKRGAVLSVWARALGPEGREVVIAAVPPHVPVVGEPRDKVKAKTRLVTVDVRAARQLGDAAANLGASGAACTGGLA
jgi:hypothetical protein